MYVYEQGNASLPPLVLLPGGGVSHKAWMPIMELLPDFYCLCPDLPGHGKSRDVPFSLESATRLVANMIKAKTPHGKAHILGHSLSGMVVLTLLRLFPEVADHVILMESSTRQPLWLVKMILPLLKLVRFMNPEKMVQSTLRQNSIPQKYATLLHDDLIDSVSYEFCSTIIMEMTKLEMPTAITCPLLVCAGSKSNGTAKWVGEIAYAPLKKYPNARGVLMPGSNHFWALQFPEVFAHMVRAWITDQPLPAVLQPVER